MPLRVVKIVLPQNIGQDALNFLKSQANINFWQEESSGDHFVASVLTDSGKSENLMDLFEKQYSHLPEFKLILFPVEAAIPRVEAEEEADAAAAEKADETAQKTPLRISREELYADIVDSAKLSRVFVFMAVLSTVVAAIGLLKSNVAVIIGAMVIAPFLGPNVALALATNLSDRDLAINALKTLLTGILIVMLLSVGMGYIFETTPDIPEIASRTQAGLSDILLAFASGCAGVLAFTTGASSAVIGVMVAVALLPPLTACGLLLGSGYIGQAAAAFLLFLTNIICINLAGVFTFLIQGVSPRVWWEADRAKKAATRALLIWTAILGVLALIIGFY